ncbi:GAF domain-containing protein [Oscillatoria sp. CS-180]|uniref:ATP-binding protein n=1 Tax=Oscillatoria sp. CS-180 TaxID=3021720 RepID=UPI00232D2C78|nr:ATP-binding protein [Oscillatoria sp. CS-180]MDB9528764.1 GAF domain-containing protein [Oscillatoria sp. CS-180]
MAVSDFVAQTRAAIAQLTDPQIQASTVGISNCDREPIHIPTAIQPHGVLLVLRKEDWRILQISQNTEDYLGRSPEQLLDQPLTQLLNEPQIRAIEECLMGEFEAVNPLRIEVDVDDSRQCFSGVVHRSEDLIVLELEPEKSQEAVNFFNFYGFIKHPVNRIQQTQTLEELCQVAVEVVKQVSGFDRVMVYRFDDEGAGSVIAEVKEPNLSSYLGLHYPATDIPQQAKYLYTLNLLRLIPDAAYEAVPIVPTQNPVTQKPLDMSLAMLRSVSPLHTEYLANMGVKASMSISLIQNHKLWGLIACHHHTPRQLSYERRTVCEFLGQVISLQLASRQDNEDAEYKLSLQSLQANFVDVLTNGQSLQEALMQNPQNLLNLATAEGAVFCENGDFTVIGKTPEPEAMTPLVSWLSSQFSRDGVYETACLSQSYPPAASFSQRASGLLAISISRMQQIYVLWFKPEVVQTVTWAGNPNKPVEIDEDGEVYLSPRQSFERWKEMVHRRSLPWKTCEVEAVLELRRTVIGLVLQKAEELAQLNLELERSNIELDAFAYIASHDLKEPLRGIHNYSSFLIEDYGEQLGDDGAHKLQTLMQLTQRMEALIDSLLHYSRLGRADLKLVTVDLKTTIGGVINLIKMSKPEQVSFQMPQQFPQLKCDLTQITELFTNLISNAIKYNDKAEKQVEIGYLTVAEAAEKTPHLIPTELSPEAIVFYVRDNGIGIKPKHLDTVFKIFKRLHPPKRFGGGAGAGLTIVKKIVERHGGRIWLDSVYGEGSTFYFTLEGLRHD